MKKLIISITVVVVIILALILSLKYSSFYYGETEKLEFHALNLPKDISVHFVLIGRQTDSDIVKNMVAASPFSDRFHLLGYRKDVRSLIKSSDIYVQSSLQEGFGRALSEAASLATPVVCTDTGGFVELVSHKKSGMIIPIKDAKKIAKSIEYLAYDKDLRVKMGKAAQNAIKENFNIQTTIEETYKLYSKLID